MTHAIKADFRYEARYEEGTQTAAQTVALGSGTCRDFAVLMMEALRSFGVATRFVTGYLYDDTSGVTRGGGSTHAGIVKANEYSRFSALNPAERGGNSRAKTVGLQPAVVHEQAV